MKNIYLAVAAICFAWIAGTFVTLNINPLEWVPYGRVMFLCIAISVFCFSKSMGYPR